MPARRVSVRGYSRARRLEKTAEDAFVKQARAAGYLTRKMNGLGNASWPDQLVIGNGFSLFIEFKREGEDLTELQADCHRELSRRDQCVYVARTVAEAWWCVRHAAHLYNASPPKGTPQ